MLNYRKQMTYFCETQEIKSSRFEAGTFTLSDRELHALRQGISRLGTGKFTL
jgi:hypothetical protein